LIKKGKTNRSEFLSGNFYRLPVNSSNPARFAWHLPGLLVLTPHQDEETLEQSPTSENEWQASF